APHIGHAAPPGQVRTVQPCLQLVEIVAYHSLVPREDLPIDLALAADQPGLQRIIAVHISPRSFVPHAFSSTCTISASTSFSPTSRIFIGISQYPTQRRH